METRLAQSKEAQEHMVELLKAIAHPVRLGIVTVLADGEEHVSSLAARLEASQAIVSQQLRILRMSGIVETSRRQGFAVYRLARPQLRQVLECMQQCCACQGAAPEGQGPPDREGGGGVTP
ncbi:MAG: winged helix-turn-helix transcriptional regulator [Deltaproteobacteria bacterium]|nr:winged helix-turn-helix transcriptional regulator [Deltaproteobacteria bacterium]